ncbi:hypothetical protein D3C71_604210 [compost metagenome]
MIGRDGAARSALSIKVQLADFERILADRIGDLLDDPFPAEQALRPTEAAKGCVGDGMGLQRLRGEAHMRVEIATVCMKEGAVGDRTGEIGGITATRGIGRVDRMDTAFLVEGDVVIDAEIVPLAGDRHIFIAVRAEFYRPVQFLRRDGGESRKLVALGFLAAEAATHAPGFDLNRVIGNAEHMRHHVLNLARMLGG